MKPYRHCLKLLAFILTLMVSGCYSIDHSKDPQGYVRHSIRLMDKCGLYSSTDVWELTRDSVLRVSKHVTSYEEAHDIIKSVISIAGGKHSFLKPPLKDTSAYVETAPVVDYLESDILYINLPAHAGIIVSDSAYVNIVIDALKIHKEDAKGVIIDLKGNHGGNMYPMIAAVSPLIKDGIILKFQSGGRHIKVMPVSLDFVLKSQKMADDDIFRMSERIPIAILIDGMTASSGEATLLAFRGMDNVCTFGAPTAGYASANASYILSDGYTLALTMGKEIARTGEVFCDDPIEPDVLTEKPLEDAVIWINSRYNKEVLLAGSVADSTRTHYPTEKVSVPN